MPVTTREVVQGLLSQGVPDMFYPMYLKKKYYLGPIRSDHKRMEPSHDSEAEVVSVDLNMGMHDVQVSLLDNTVSMYKTFDQTLCGPQFPGWRAGG